MHEQTVAEPPEHPHHAHGLWLAYPALVVQVRHVQALVQTAFNAPSRTIIPQPLGGGQLRRQETGHQRHRFRGVLAKFTPQQGHLLHEGKVHLLGGRRTRTQHPHFQLAFVELATARQCGRGLPRGKNPPVGR